MSMIDDLLSKVKYNPDTISHLIPNNEFCKKCEKRVCEYICPAKVYEWDAEKNKLQVTFENCLECGACRIACEKNCIKWVYPKGKCGITLKNG